MLRAFGSDVGVGVVIKPRVRIKFPWKLRVGNYSWIGESVWIDNLARTSIGEHVCVSQGAYICTGSHDWSKESFDLITNEVTLGSHSWICAKCIVAPGTRIGEGAVIGLGSVARGEVAPWTVNSGIPIKEVGVRRIYN